MTSLEYFREMCKIPHGSGNTDAISEWFVGFAKEHNLQYVKDSMGNVIIYKEGSAGRENEEPVILQSHMDMVCVSDDPSIDMSKAPLILENDGEWLWAKNTTLGADDGIGAAMTLEILADDTISHPPIEAVITVEEETGMDGAKNLDIKLLKGKKMLNFDHGVDGSITVGCSGGIKELIDMPCMWEALKDDMSFYRVSISGLLGGHSGGMIHENRANASRLLARLFYGLSLKMELSVCEFEGGTADNVIPSEAVAVVAVPSESAEDFERLTGKHEKLFKMEYPNEKGLKLFFEKCEARKTGVAPSITKKMCRMLSSVPDGMRKKMDEFEDCAQQSSNMGVVRLDEKGLHVIILIRSAITEERQEVADLITPIAEHEGGICSFESEHPGWIYNRESKLITTAVEAYKALYNKEPSIGATHGSLETGFFAERIEGFDCIAMGPTMEDIHSTRERLNLKSIETTYAWVKEILRRI